MKFSAKKVFVFSAVSIALLAALVRSHCQIPCGIYDDPARIQSMAEHIRTIEKATNSIHELTAAGDKNYNQIVRWVMNKEDHAQQFSEIVTYYWMAQRIKPAMPGDDNYKDYVTKITLLHRMQVEAMKAKQNADLQHVENLRSLLGQFEKAYFGPSGAAASHDHSHASSAAQSHTH